jgi:hypothetical protein
MTLKANNSKSLFQDQKQKKIKEYQYLLSLCSTPTNIAKPYQPRLSSNLGMSNHTIKTTDKPADEIEHQAANI